MLRLSELHADGLIVFVGAGVCPGGRRVCASWWLRLVSEAEGGSCDVGGRCRFGPHRALTAAAFASRHDDLNPSHIRPLGAGDLLNLSSD